MRIISLQPSVSVILDRLGCLDSLAACTRYCAVTRGQLNCILDDLLDTPGPNLVDGLWALAQAIHPEIFSALEGTFGRQLDCFSARCV